MRSPSLLEFADKMNEIMPSLIREFSRRQANELYKGKITLPQFLILDFLLKKDNSKMSDLAHFMKVTTAAMTGIVERLVKYGYVVRGYEPDDRRIIKIGLTSKGKTLVKRIDEQRRKMIINIFGRLSESDRQDYLRILMNVYNVLLKEKKVD